MDLLKLKMEHCHFVDLLLFNRFSLYQATFQSIYLDLMIESEKRFLTYIKECVKGSISTAFWKDFH